MDNTTKLQAKYQEQKRLQEEITRLEKEQTEFNKLTSEMKLATLIHDKMCNWNHTDGCGWGYEDWDGYSKKAYREKANAILSVVSYTDAVKVIELL